MTRTETTRIQITEGRRAWMILWPTSRVTTTTSAADALKRVKRAARRRASASDAFDVTLIEWSPKTRIGRAAVKAIQ